MPLQPVWRRALSGAASALACLLALPLCASAHGAEPRVTGTLIQTHGHRLDGTMVGKTFSIRSGGRVRRLAADQPQSLVGRRVRIDDAGAAPGLQGRVRAAGGRRAAAVAPGPRSLLVILLTTPDRPEPAATQEEMRNAIFTDPTSSSAMYESQSGGATRLVGRVRADGDVAGPFAIGVASAGCAYRDIGDAAAAAARSAGWAVDSYDHVLFALPQFDCGTGLGELGGRLLWSGGFSALLGSTVAHELGHNLGADHASSYRCVDAGGTPTTLSASCETERYGDPFDFMGGWFNLMSSWHRAQVGQLPAGQQLGMQSSETVTLVSTNDFVAAGPRLLLIPRKVPGVPVSSWLAVERRSTRAPFDMWAGDPAATGLFIRVVPSLTVSTPTLLLDATPATTSFHDAALQVGATLHDDAHGIAIRLNSTTGTAADVTVTMPAPVDEPPSAPAGISYRGDTNGVVVTWSPADDDKAVAHYEVRRDGVLMQTSAGLSFDDADVSGLTAPTYSVTAVDTGGNRGAATELRAELLDATPPGLVGGLSASVSGTVVTLRWAPARDNRAVAGYRVSRAGRILGDVTSTGFTDRPAAGPQRYAVSAIDVGGNLGAPGEVEVLTAPAGPAATAARPPSSSTTVGIPPPAPPVAVAATVARAAAPRIAVLRRSRRGRMFTTRFAAPGATSMRAYRGRRLVARTSGPRLTVRLRVPRGAKAPTVKIVASSRAGTTSRRFTIR